MQVFSLVVTKQSFLNLFENYPQITTVIISKCSEIAPDII